MALLKKDSASWTEKSAIAAKKSELSLMLPQPLI